VAPAVLIGRLGKARYCSSSTSIAGVDAASLIAPLRCGVCRREQAGGLRRLAQQSVQARWRNSSAVGLTPARQCDAVMRATATAVVVVSHMSFSCMTQTPGVRLAWLVMTAGRLSRRLRTTWGERTDRPRWQNRSTHAPAG